MAPAEGVQMKGQRCLKHPWRGANMNTTDNNTPCGGPPRQHAPAALAGGHLWSRDREVRGLTLTAEWIVDG